MLRQVLRILIIATLTAAISVLFFELITQRLQQNLPYSILFFLAVFMASLVAGPGVYFALKWLPLSTEQQFGNSLQHKDEFPEQSKMYINVFNSLNANIAILDRLGTIIAVNEAWEHFGFENGASQQVQRGVGLNYLAICQSASGENSEEATAALTGIQGVLSEYRNSFILEYPCHSPEQKRWFLMSATPLSTGEGSVVIIHIDITARKLLEEALLERELHLRLILDQVPAILWSTDRNLHFASVSGSGLKNPKVFPHPALGTKISDFFSESQDHHLILNAHEQALQGQSVNFEARVSDLYYQAFVQPLLDIQGNIQGVLGITLDITDRKKEQIKIQKQSARLQVLSDVSRAFAEASFTSKAVFATLNTIARRTAELIGDTCVITLLAENGQFLTPVAFYNQNPEVQNLLRQSIFATPYDVNQGIAGTVARTGQSLLIEHILKDQVRSMINSNSLPFLEHCGVHSILIVPLIIEGNVIGTIGLTRDTPHDSYTPQDQVFLQDLADRAALAVQNARLFEETQERKNQLSILHTNLDRSNTLIAALSQVATQLQNSIDLSQVVDILGVELKKLKVVFFIGLFDLENRVLVWQYNSLDPVWLSAAEKVVGMSYRGLKISTDQFPGFSALIHDRKGFFVKEVLELSHSLLSQINRSVLEEVYLSIGFSENTKAIVLPLIVDQRPLGVMSVLGEELEEADVPAFSIFSGQVAAALENAHLFEITKTHAEQLSALTARLAEVEELERRQLAQELHDQVGQTLTALGINLNVIRNLLIPEEGNKALHLIDDSLKLVEETVERTRDIMAELRPPVLEDYGLLAALQWYADKFVLGSTLLIFFHGDEPNPRLPTNVESAMFRISQEILLNIAKHAQAQEVHISLGSAENRVRLTIKDNGVGFDPDEIHFPGRDPTWGLLSIHERAEAMGGQVLIESAPGKGTQITIEVPL